MRPDLVQRPIDLREVERVGVLPGGVVPLATRSLEAAEDSLPRRRPQLAAPPRGVVIEAMPELTAVAGHERRDEPALWELQCTLPSHRVRQTVVDEMDRADSLGEGIIRLAGLHLQHVELQRPRRRLEELARGLDLARLDVHGAELRFEPGGD